MADENHIPAVSKHPIAERRTLRAIAIFEAVKGFAALASGIGLLSLMRHDVRHLAVELIGRFGLNPSAQYSSILLHYADIISDANIRLVVLLASGYIILRFVEAYGLWNDLVWGEWLGALSGGLYIPFEVLHLVHRPSLISALVLIGNVFVVGFLAYELWRRRGRSRKLVVP
ncbi:MAG TPA: DUF2127 domain-containing protein [Rhodocyclaceae bacterium]|nr:DUF2127 domain-containing protein [Rhodocyclaceae bacterium]